MIWFNIHTFCGIIIVNLFHHSYFYLMDWNWHKHTHIPIHTRKTHTLLVPLSLSLSCLPPFSLHTSLSLCFSTPLFLSPHISLSLFLFHSLLVSEEWLRVLLLCSFGAWIRSVKCQRQWAVYCSRAETPRGPSHSVRQGTAPKSSRHPQDA